MRKLILLTAMLTVMCVTASHAKTILIDGAYLYADASGQPTVDFYTTNFPGWTVTTFNGGDTTSAAVQEAIAAADVLVLNRRIYSADYSTDDGAYYSGLTIPVIFHTSYVTRSTRLAYEGSTQNNASVAGDETMVTDAGATFFEVPAGTYDWHTNGFDAVGCAGNVGTGTVLATIGGYNLAVIWHTGDTDASGRVQAGPRLLFNLDAFGGSDATYPNYVRLPETAAGLQALVIAVQKLIGDTQAAHDPVVLPDNDDGTSGTLLSQMQVEVTFGWDAGEDPNTARGYPVNPDIKGHYIYLSSGDAEDPNVYLLDYVEQVHNADPALTDPYNEYGPVTLAQATEYSWQIEEALIDPNGDAYPAGNENNIKGQFWTFTTIAAVPSAPTGIENTLTDSSGNASFSVTVGEATTTCRWFKVGSPAVQLSDGGIYSGTQTTTLTITGATVADEGQFYCIAYNGDPDAGGLASEPSDYAWLWYPRLVHYYPFDVINVVGDTSSTPDTEGSLDAVLMEEDDAGLPTLNTTDAKVGIGCLDLDNGTVSGQYAQIPAGVADYDDITISAWVYPKTSSGWGRIFDFGNDTSNYIFMSPAGPGYFRFASKYSGANEQTLSGDVLTEGQWYLVTVTITGDTGRLYRNGELIATNTSMTNNPFDMASTLNYIGKSQYTADPEYYGLIDDMKIYNYARTTVEIARDYIAVMGGSVCNRETYDMAEYDVNDNCIIDLPDFAALAARWLEDDRIYAE